MSIHTLTQNDQIRHERRVLGQPRHIAFAQMRRAVFLSAIAEFLVTNIGPILLKIQKDFAAV